MAASVYALLTRSVGVGPIMASGVAAVALGLAGGLLAHRVRVPVDGARRAGQLRAAARSDHLPGPVRAGRLGVGQGPAVDPVGHHHAAGGVRGAARDRHRHRARRRARLAVGPARAGLGPGDDDPGSPAETRLGCGFAARRSSTYGVGHAHPSRCPRPRVRDPSLAACTAAPEPVASSSGSASSSASTASPSPSATPDVVVRGADARLAALVEKVYAGKTGVTATATTGTWKSEKVAVVTAGDDVTLAVGPDWKVVGGWWPSLGKAEPDLGKGPRFVLVVGSDARPDEPLKGSRGDTLQVLGIDGKGGGGVMGIPRDTWAPLPGGGSAKINAAFSSGGGAGQLAAVRAADRVARRGLRGDRVQGLQGDRQPVGRAADGDRQEDRLPAQADHPLGQAVAVGQGGAGLRPGAEVAAQRRLRALGAPGRHAARGGRGGAAVRGGRHRRRR